MSIRLSQASFLCRLVLFLALTVTAFGSSAPAAKGSPTVTAMTVQTITWNVIGLDSNDVTVGPNEFPVAARACNIGAEPATNVVATFVWDSANPYINLSGASSLSATSIAAGACRDFYFNVVITRDPAAYNTARSYHITVSADNAPPVSTPMPRELYVEMLLSQNRNDVISITGPSTVYIGNTYTFTMTSKTATQGYEQIESFLNFPNTLFEVIAVATTYSAPPGATNDTVYGNACGWNDDPTLPNYRTCSGAGKLGGDLVTVYTVRILGIGEATITNLIYDFSGSSYHYNADFGDSPDNTLTITAASPLTALKSSALLTDADGNGAASPGDTLRYTVVLQNLGQASITGIVYNDTPDPNTTLINGSVTTTQGTITTGNNAGDTSISAAIGTLTGGASATIVYDVTINSPLPTNVTQLINQGVATSNELPPVLTDDPNTVAVGDPTVTPVVVPTAVSITNFNVVRRGDSAVVEWTTSAEANTLGFYIYRSIDGDRSQAQRVTPDLIPGQGSYGGSYSWTDATVEVGRTYTYWLEEVELNGSTYEYGPRHLSLPTLTTMYIPIVSR